MLKLHQSINFSHTKAFIAKSIKPHTRFFVALSVIVSIAVAVALNQANHLRLNAFSSQTQITNTHLIATHAPVTLSSATDIQTAWKFIGTAIMKDDKTTFRAHSTDEVYKKVVLPRDINGTQAVVIDSHWDIISGRRSIRPDEPVGLPEVRGPGECTNDDTIFARDDKHRDGYTCAFTVTADETYPIAHFYLKKMKTTWIVIDFTPYYG